ncbi:MAG TPA: Clp protease N-terminal domain-containing protein, partial [Bacteroidales bacterium]|nr:Clp protease N-terminal domain-containing protein [Bacteroidales bacterium]
MNLNLPDELNQILSFAREEAMRLGSYTITGDHVFLALIRHEKNKAYELLTSLNLLLWQMKNLIESRHTGEEMIPPDKADQ